MKPLIFKLDLGDGVSCTVITKAECDDEGYIESVEWIPKRPRMRGKKMALYKKWFNEVNRQIADHFDCVIVHIYSTDHGPEAFLFAPGEEPKLATNEELLKWIQ